MKKKEMTLLNYGLHYSFIKPRTSYFTNLIMETENAIKLSDTTIQDTF
jgi:hypothetical protein